MHPRPPLPEPDFARGQLARARELTTYAQEHELVACYGDELDKASYRLTSDTHQRAIRAWETWCDVSQAIDDTPALAQVRLAFGVQDELLKLQNATTKCALTDAIGETFDAYAPVLWSYLVQATVGRPKKEAPAPSYDGGAAVAALLKSAAVAAGGK